VGTIVDELVVLRVYTRDSTSLTYITIIHTSQHVPTINNDNIIVWDTSNTKAFHESIRNVTDKKSRPTTRVAETNGT